MLVAAAQVCTKECEAIAMTGIVNTTNTTDISDIQAAFTGAMQAWDYFAILGVISMMLMVCKGVLVIASLYRRRASLCRRRNYNDDPDCGGYDRWMGFESPHENHDEGLRQFEEAWEDHVFEDQDEGQLLQAPGEQASSSSLHRRRRASRRESKCEPCKLARKPKFMYRTRKGDRLHTSPSCHTIAMVPESELVKQQVCFFCTRLKD